MPNVEVYHGRTTATTDFKRIKITGHHIREYLAGKGHDVPANATVTIQVPGGGDWAHASLDIDDDYPVFVEWTVKETEGPIRVED